MDYLVFKSCISSFGVLPVSHQQNPLKRYLAKIRLQTNNPYTHPHTHQHTGGGKKKVYTSKENKIKNY